MQKILVVEDYREVSDFIAIALTGFAGYEVITAEDGNAALSFLEAEHPDLALVDMRLPGVSGIEVGRHALSLDVPVVLMTGDRMVSGRLVENRIPHLVKPFPLSDLFKALEKESARSMENRRG